MKKLLSILLASMALTANFAFAITPQEKTMLDKLTKDYPKLNVEDVVFLPTVNLYELHLKNNSSLAFTNPTVDYFLMAGEIVDAKNKKNISSDRELVNVQRFFTNLPTDKAIIIKYGKGTRKVAIFTDPDCPFCRASDQDFHKKLTKEDITFYYYMNPLRIPGHEQAPLKAKKIWCAPDKGKAWLTWMNTNVLPTNPGTCKNPVDETKALADSIGFTSTPTLVFDNGYVWRGQMMAEEMKQMFVKAPAAKNPR
jgi:thiol:disulfide interchange protein DsbC